MNPEEGRAEERPARPAGDADGARATGPVFEDRTFIHDDPPSVDAAGTALQRPRRKRRAKPDPWAHRRGEPRVFAFLWTLFLFAATALTFMAAVSMGGTSPDVMRPATQALLSVTIAGIVLLWPMVRLSQSADEHPVSGVAQDLVVVLIPAQAVIWPQWLGWLGRWPISVIGAASVLMIAWGVLAGGLLALAQVSHRRADLARRRWTPWIWMIAFVALAAAGSIVALASAAPPPDADRVPPEIRRTAMLSPVTAMYEITRDRSWSGKSAGVIPAHWWAIGSTAAAALPLWVLAALGSRSRRAGPGIH